MSEPFELKIVWVIEDIKSVRPEWSDETCEEFLSDYAGDIEEVSIQAGWELINTMVNEYDDE